MPALAGVLISLSSGMPHKIDKPHTNTMLKNVSDWCSIYSTEIQSTLFSVIGVILTLVVMKVSSLGHFTAATLARGTLYPEVTGLICRVP